MTLSPNTSSPCFEEPLKEIEFDSDIFSIKALELAQQHYVDAKLLEKSNTDRVIAL